MNLRCAAHTLAFCAASFFFIILHPIDVGAETAYPGRAAEEVVLTGEERAWLDAHPDIVLGYTDSFEPEVIVNPDGTYRGMLVDFLDELNRRLGTGIGLRVYPIPELLEKAREKEIDGILEIHPDYADKLGLLKTSGYFSAYPAVFARKEISIDGPEGLAGRRIAVIEGVHFSDEIIEPYREGATIVKVKDALEGLQFVSGGEADLFIGVSLNSYYLTKYQLFDVAIQHVFYDYSDKFGMAVRSDWPELVPILNNGIASFTEDEIEALASRWGRPVRGGNVVELNEDERAWLAEEHNVAVRVVNFPPYLILDEGKMSGIVIDYLNLIAARTGVTFEFIIENRPWQEALESLMNLQGPDVITSVSPMAEREPYMSFSDPYFVAPRMIFTRIDDLLTAGIDDLHGRTLAVPRGTLVQKRVEEEHPDISLLTVDSDLASIRAVSERKADAYIGNLINTSQAILLEGISNLKVAAPSPFGDDVYAFGVRRDWPELRSIINKGLGTISRQEQMAIRSKYLSIRYEHAVGWAEVAKWLFLAAGLAGGVLFFVLAWNRSLKKEVQERTAELQYQAALLENVSDAVISVDLDYRVTSWNSAAEMIYGWSAAEAVGKRYGDLTELNYIATSREEMLKTVNREGSWRGEVRQRRKDGTHIFVQSTVSLVRDGEGNPVGVVGVGRDITEHKKADEELRDSEEKFRGLVEQSPFSVQIFNPDGRLIQVNHSFMELWGVSDEELADLFKKYNILEDEEVVKRGVQPLLEKAFKGESVTLPPIEYDSSKTLEKMEMDGDKGHRRWVQARFYPLKNSKGEILKIVGTEEDITARVEAESKIKKDRERLKALGAQLTIAEEMERRRIAVDLHDRIGQTLAFALIQIARAEKATSDRMTAAALEETSKTLTQVIEDTRGVMFDLSPPLMVEAGLESAVREWLVEKVAKAHGINADFHHDESQVPLERNMSAILFRNVRELLTNVVKHAEAERVTVSFSRTGDTLKIVVEDDGSGFDPQKVFSASLKEGGFGLFSIRERMEDFGGTLEIISAPGKGCSAILEVPVEIP